MHYAYTGEQERQRFRLSPESKIHEIMCAGLAERELLLPLNVVLNTRVFL